MPSQSINPSRHDKKCKQTRSKNPVARSADWAHNRTGSFLTLSAPTKALSAGSRKWLSYFSKLKTATLPDIVVLASGMFPCQLKSSALRPLQSLPPATAGGLCPFTETCSVPRNMKFLFSKSLPLRPLQSLPPADSGWTNKNWTVTCGKEVPFFSLPPAPVAALLHTRT